MHATEQLRRITLSILDASQPAASLRSQVVEMATILERSRPSRPASGEPVPTAGAFTKDGLALSPELAISCTEDYVRTIQFLRGTHAAISSMQKRFPGRATHVLYAGCGPYATLAIPLMTIFAAAEATFTLLDIHAESTNSVRGIVEALDLEASVATIATADAGAYRINAGQTPDIILLEILQAALAAEPQVAVSRHLLAQAPDAILLPEEIRIDLVLVDPAIEFATVAAKAGTEQKSRERIPVATAFAVNRQTISSWLDIHGDRLPGATVCMPGTIDDRFEPMFFTHICIFGDRFLDAYDSGLTRPQYASIDRAPKPAQTIQFHYELGRRPRLHGEVSCGDASA